MSETPLNVKNRPMIVTFLLANILVISAIAPKTNFANLLALPGLVDLLTTSVAGSLFAIIFNALIPPDIKDIFVFWRTNDVLPGHRAFSEFARKDKRFAEEDLRKVIDPWPTEPKNQNSTWYKLYKRFTNEPSVVDAHQQFLLARDLTAMTIIIFVVFIVGQTVLHTNPWKLILSTALFLLVEYFVIRIAARNAGNRLIRDVLACTVSQHTEKPTQ